MKLYCKHTGMRLGMLIFLFLFGTADCTFAYEVAVGLGSTADKSATAAMGDREKWPMVADLSWGPLANLYPVALLTHAQQEAVFNNFRQRRAIAEIPYSGVSWQGKQPDIAFIEGFGFKVPYVFSINEAHQDGMLSRDEIINLKNRFPAKKIIMIARSWVRDQDHVQAVADVVDGVCIEYIPSNVPYNIARHVAPFAGWAWSHDKILLFLMPPQPDDYQSDRYVRAVKQLAQVVYNENKGILPHGWLQSDRFIFVPANYTYGESRIPYVTEDSTNSILAAAKALLMMRPSLDAGPVRPAGRALPPVFLLLP